MVGRDSHADASPRFFRRFSRELEQLAVDLDDLQVYLSFADRLERDAERTVRIQALDELVQRARALADVADHMTIEAPSSAAAIQRVIGGIGLRSLATRLAGDAPATEKQEGEVDLF